MKMRIAKGQAETYARHSVRKKLLIAILSLSILLPIALLAKDEYQKVKNAKIPEYDEEGNRKSIVYAKMARIPKKKGATIVEIEGLQIDLFKDNEVDVTIKAEACEYERTDRRAESENPVEITSDKFDITGSNFVYDGKRQRFIINRDARVTLKDLKNGTAFGNPPEDTPPPSPAKPPEPTP